MHEKINDYSPTEIRVLFAYNKGVLFFATLQNSGLIGIKNNDILLKRKNKTKKRIVIQLIHRIRGKV